MAGLAKRQILGMRKLMRIRIAVAAVTCAAAGASAQEADIPQPIGNLGQYFGRDNYPPEAIRAREQGRVVASLMVDAAGRVTGCVVDVSSGSAALDETTCRIAQQRIAFTPAKDEQGRPVAGRFTLPVRWSLEEETESPMIEVSGPISYVTESEWVIGTDGRVESCRLISTEGKDAVDYCRRYPVGSSWGATYTSNGIPARVTVRDRFGRKGRVVTTRK